MREVKLWGVYRYSDTSGQAAVFFADEKLARECCERHGSDAWMHEQAALLDPGEIVRELDDAKGKVEQLEADLFNANAALTTERGDHNDTKQELADVRKVLKLARDELRENKRIITELQVCLNRQG